MKAKVQTWLENIQNGNIKSKTTRILNYIIERSEFGDVDIYTMRIDLGISHQSLTAIISEFQDYGLVKVIDVVEIEGNYYSLFKYVTNKQERDKLVYERDKEKVLNWLKQGIVKYGSYCTPQVSDMLVKNHDRISKEHGTPVQLTLF